MNEYVAAVDRHLPRWLPERPAMVADLRSHLADRLEEVGAEPELTSQLEPPAEYAAALVAEHRFEPAGHGARIAAFLIDAALGLPLTVFVIFIVHASMMLFATGWSSDMLGLWWQSLAGAAASGVLFLVAIALGMLAVSALTLSVVYFPVAEAIWGTTIGKRVMGLVVVSEDGTRVTWLKAIGRRIPFYFEFFLLDAVFALFTRQRQRAFDLVSRTRVVRHP